MVERRLAWHTIIALRQHKRSNDVRRGMTSPPLDCTHGRQHRACYDITALGKNTRSDDVGRGIPSSPLDSTDDRPSSGVACHSSPWKAHTVGRSRALHAIIALGPAQMAAIVGRGISLYPLDSTNGRPSSDVPAHNGRPWPARIGRGLRNIHRVPNKTCGCSWRT